MGDDYITLISNQKRNLLIHSNLNFMCHKSFLNGKYLKSKEYLLNPLFFQIISMNSYKLWEGEHSCATSFSSLHNCRQIAQKSSWNFQNREENKAKEYYLYRWLFFSDIHTLYPAGFLLVWAWLLLFSFERVLPKISKIKTFKTSTI